MLHLTVGTYKVYRKLRLAAPRRGAGKSLLRSEIGG
jgi:hypothetical protein